MPKSPLARAKAEDIPLRQRQPFPRRRARPVHHLLHLSSSLRRRHTPTLTPPLLPRTVAQLVHLRPHRDSSLLDRQRGGEYQVMLLHPPPPRRDSSQPINLPRMGRMGVEAGAGQEDGTTPLLLCSREKIRSLFPLRHHGQEQPEGNILLHCRPVPSPDNLRVSICLSLD